MNVSTSPSEAGRHEIRRIRHESRGRSLTVTATARLTPHMLRVHLASPELADFTSAGFDDHIKLFLPGEAGPVMRDYTPRGFDPVARTLTLDFALHDAGPATAWALGAKVGDRLEIGGPRGSAVVPDDFDWYLLIGDETALPAIGRRLEEMRAGVPVTTIVAVDGEADIQRIETPADWRPQWIQRDREGADDGVSLGRALAAFDWAAGDGFVWIAAEARVARTLKSAVLERGHRPGWLKAAGYWVRGEPGGSDKMG